MTEVTYRFKFPNGPHEESLRKAFPLAANLSPWEQERQLRFAVHRFVPYLGINQPDALYNGKPLGDTFNAPSMGWSLLEWINQNWAFNSGLGPTIDCASISNLYVAALGAWGIAARRVMVLFRTDGPDHIAEFYLDGRWNLVIPQLNAFYQNSRKGGLFSYLGVYEDRRAAVFWSETKGYPMCRKMDRLHQIYKDFECDVAAYAVNGNAVTVDGTTPVYLSLTPEECQNGDWVAAPSVEKINGCTKAQLYPTLGPLTEDMEFVV